MFSLILESSKEDYIELELGSIDNNIDIGKLSFPKVYSDLKYNLKIKYKGISKEYKVKILLNGHILHPLEENPLIINEDGTGDGTKDLISSKKIFNDSFGFAHFAVIIDNNSEETEIYYSNYISILFKENNNDIFKKIQFMYEYISKKDITLLEKNCDIISKATLKTYNKNDNAFLKLLLAEEISKLYELNFGYFKANSKFKMTEKFDIGNAKKMKHMSPKTIKYISLHPEYLKESSTYTGININGKYYCPDKTLISKYSVTKDIYENRIIVGFLDKILSDLKNIAKDIKKLINLLPDEHNKEDGYIHSAFCILEVVKPKLKAKYDDTNKLIKKYTKLLTMYSNAFDIQKIKVNKMPKPTDIFLSIPKYNVIFNGICKWFNYGTMDISSESLMFSIDNISSIYELFVLCKLLNDIEEEGYKLSQSEKYEYTFDHKTVFKNSTCKNIFVFEKNPDEKLTLYYQPVVYDKDSDIGLFRNTSIAFNGEDYGQPCYYAPDYIIKRKTDGKTTYDIIDAKFRTQKGAKATVPELSYKYLFSLSPCRENADIIGLHIIYGKDNDKDESASVYIDNKQIHPKVTIIPCSNCNEDKSLFKAIIE